LPDLICDTSVIQYLHQLRHLQLLRKLADRIIIPPAVADELSAGRALGIDLPDLSEVLWLDVQKPVSVAALPLINDLGPGETQVLMLALELEGVIAVLDDRLAREIAKTLELKYTGTLGILLDAKRTGYITEVSPLLDQLEALRFRIAPSTRQLILELADEGEYSP